MQEAYRTPSDFKEWGIWFILIERVDANKVCFTTGLPKGVERNEMKNGTANCSSMRKNIYISRILEGKHQATRWDQRITSSWFWRNNLRCSSELEHHHWTLTTLKYFPWWWWWTSIFLAFSISAKSHLDLKLFEWKSWVNTALHFNTLATTTNTSLPKYWALSDFVCSWIALARDCYILHWSSLNCLPKTGSDNETIFGQHGIGGKHGSTGQSDRHLQFVLTICLEITDLGYDDG